jgi:hypothetical protein
MAITLDDVVLEQMNTNETLGQLVDRTNILIEMEGDSFAGLELLNEQFEDFLGLVRKQYALEDEARREKRDGLVPAPQDDEEKLKPEEAYKGIGMPIITLGAGLAAFASNFVKSFVEQTKKMFRINVFKPIESIFGFIGDKLKSIGNFFKNIGSKISGLFGGISTSGLGIVDNIKKMLLPVTEFGANLMKSPFVRFLAGVGKLLGRIAWPFVVAYELYQNLTEEFAKSTGGIMGSIGAAIRGVLKAAVDFFAIFLDLPKDIISWFAGLVGFDGVEKALDSFTFAGLGDLLVDGLSDLIGFAVDWLGNLFGDIGTDIKDFASGFSFEDFGKNIVRAVLPAPDFLAFEVPSIEVLGKTIGGGSIDLNPIPASVYEYAGLNAPEGSSSETPSGGGDTTTNNVSTVGGTEVTGGDKLSSENIEVLRQQFNAEALQAINEENAITNAINTESVTNVGSSQSAPIVIQDNSVNSSNQSNVNQSVQSRRSMRSPTRNNGTRASAYEA